MMKAFVLLVIASMILIACGGVETSTGDILDKTSWELVFYRKTTVMDGTSLTANFEDGRVSGSAGCNSYFGSYDIAGETITFSDVGNTEMACMSPEGVMEQESLFLEYLRDAQRFEINNDQLMIFRTDGEALTFVPLSK